MVGEERDEQRMNLFGRAFMTVKERLREENGVDAVEEENKSQGSGDVVMDLEDDRMSFIGERACLDDGTTM